MLRTPAPPAARRRRAEVTTSTATETDHRRIEQRQLELAAELLAIFGIVGKPLQHHVEMAGLFAGGDGGAEIIGKACGKSLRPAASVWPSNTRERTAMIIPLMRGCSVCCAPPATTLPPALRNAPAWPAGVKTRPAPLRLMLRRTNIARGVCRRRWPVHAPPHIDRCQTPARAIAGAPDAGVFTLQHAFTFAPAASRAWYSKAPIRYEIKGKKIKGKSIYAFTLSFIFALFSTPLSPPAIPLQRSIPRQHPLACRPGGC